MENRIWWMSLNCLITRFCGDCNLSINIAIKIRGRMYATHTCYREMIYNSFRVIINSSSV